MTAVDLESLAADVVALAMKAGASDAEAVAREGDEFSVNVRMGEVETLKESGSRALGLRVFLGKRSASASTSDLTADGIRQLVEGAMALARVTEEDPFTGLPETEEFGAVAAICIFTSTTCIRCRGRSGLSGRGGRRLRRWRRMRASRNSDGGSFDAATGRKVLANSRGFVGSYRTSYAGVSAAPLAMDDERADAARRLVVERARASRILNRLKLLGLRRHGARCGGWARGACRRSGCRLCFRRRWRGR